ncbi:HesA/MoeB/ThiF family protein [Thalassotalea ganghwensis]
MSVLTDKEFIRYSRQLMLPQLGEQGQLCFKQSHIVIVGVGGLGCSAAQYLAAAGIGELTLIDHDTVELSNLSRQLLFKDKDIGLSKVHCAEKALTRLNPHLKINAFDQEVSQVWSALSFSGVDIVIDCSDNLTTRAFINRQCRQMKLKLVSGSAIGVQGQLLSLDFSEQQSPCYQCWLPEIKEQESSCRDLGVLSSIVGVIGTMQATAALRLLLGDKAGLNQLLLFDGWQMSLTPFKVVKNSQCCCCG